MPCPSLFPDYLGMSEMAEQPDETTGETVEPLDPIAHIQNAIASTVDDGSLLTGYVVIAEWIETDGGNSISVFHTPMPPWHLDGLVRFGLDTQGGQMLPVLADFDFDDEDDDF